MSKPHDDHFAALIGLDPEAFWARVDKTGPCWLWTGSEQPKTGYGQITTHRGRSWRAHRLAWAFTHGRIPNDLSVLHHCDVRLCCNPAHLFLGTGVDNVRDMDTKGRRVTTPGEAHGMAVLTANDVRLIRFLAVHTYLSQRAIARHFNVTQAHISNVVTRRRWASI